jgi:two-component system sensor histidine kinase BaeS
MNRSITLKLVLAFLIVSIIGAALAAALARWGMFEEFDRLVLDQAQSEFIADVSTYYQTYGSWTGVAGSLPPRAPAPLPQPQPMDRDRPGQQPPAPPPPSPESQQPPFAFALVDQNGYVVVPAGPYRIGDHIPTAVLEQGVEVEVDSQVVGTVLTAGEPPALTPREEQFLARINLALLYAALGATAIALFLGVLLARTLTRPVRELTAATRAMAKGELEQQVPVHSQDELGELAAAFNQMSADLARANELRRQMTADIAHDLRTPLSVITGYTEALRDGVLPPTPETFQTMHQEAEHLSLLVKDLRTLSLADAGELTLTRQLVHPHELLERMAAAYLPKAQELEATLQVTAEANVPPVNVDPERMVQVLGNLVSNALRYTPAGGQISLAATQQGNNVLLTVQDNGVGIAPDELPRIFDRFYRGDKARQASKGESGLGLAIAKSLVELHGGTITVESTLGEGATFTIFLPASPGPPGCRPGPSCQ